MQESTAMNRPIKKLTGYQKKTIAQNSTSTSNLNCRLSFCENPENFMCWSGGILVIQFVPIKNNYSPIRGTLFRIN